MSRNRLEMPTDEPLLSPPQAARLLGVEARLLLTLVETKGLPYVDLGLTPTGRQRYKFRPAALRQWIADQERRALPTQPEGRKIRPDRPASLSAESKEALMRRYGWDGVDRFKRSQ